MRPQVDRKPSLQEFMEECFLFIDTPHLYNIAISVRREILTVSLFALAVPYIWIKTRGVQILQCFCSESIPSHRPIIRSPPALLISNTISGIALFRRPSRRCHPVPSLEHEEAVSHLKRFHSVSHCRCHQRSLTHAVKYLTTKKHDVDG
jgi:hypothetical protein